MLSTAVLSTPIWRRVCLTLAALAVVMKVLAPPGFMIAQAPERPFEIVLCTGHGAVTTELAANAGRADPAKKAPGDAGKHDAPCAFFGHGQALAAPSADTALLIEKVRYAAEAPLRPRLRHTPGRGLAAPPLPARGPPSQRI